MPGTFGFIGKDVVSLMCVLSMEEGSILTSEPGMGGWGVVYFRSGDILLKSHPFATADAKGFLQVIREADTGTILGRFESAAAPPPGKWNMQPFRYRGWVYTQHGNIGGFGRMRERVVSSMPDFLGRSLKGTSDAECVFHLILSFLYDEGKLDSPDVDPETISSVLKHTLEYLRKVCEEYGSNEMSLNLLISNGELLAGYNANQDGRMAIYEGRGECTRCDYREKCKLYRYSESSRAALVMFFRHFPEAFVKKNFTPIQADTFFVVTRDVTVESMPGRTSLP